MTSFVPVTVPDSGPDGIMVKNAAGDDGTKAQDGLHLLAFDDEDLAVIAAHLQDAIVRIADMTFAQRERRFAFLASRFDWTAAESKTMQRRTAGVHFEHVLKVQHSGFEQKERDAVLNLLSIVFEPADVPAGKVTLLFSAGAAIRLDVECLDAQMNDIGAGWRTRKRPAHELPGDGG